MAKITKKKEEQEIVVGEAVEVVPVEEVSVEVEPVAKQEKLVRIRVKEKFKCYIGEGYYFEKGKIYSVPEHVKRTLMQRDKLLPM